MIYKKNEIKKIIKTQFTWLLNKGFHQYKAEFLLKVRNEIIQGIYFQPAESKHAVCITVFIQPLFIREDTIHLSYGYRMNTITNNKEEWVELNEIGKKSIDNFLHKHGLRFLELNSSPSKILNNKNEYSLWKDENWSAPYCLMYCAVYEDRNEEYENYKENALKYLKNQQIGWMKKRLDELEDLAVNFKNGQCKYYLEQIVSKMKLKLKIDR